MVKKLLDKKNIISFLKKVREFITLPSHNRTLVGLIAIIVIAVSVPVTVIFLQQATQTQQSAHLADCPVIELKCGKDPDVTSYCSNASSFKSTDQVHIDTTVNCGKTTCGVTHNSPACDYVRPDSCPSGSIGCRTTGICSAANGLTQAVGTSNYCHISGQVCCKAAPTPTPTPKVAPSCTAHVFSDGNHGVCVGAGSSPISTCLDANFYTGLTDCKTGTICCGSPAFVQNTGIVCGANHNGACYIYNVVKTTIPVVCPSGMNLEYQTTSDTSDGTSCGTVHHPIAKTTVSCCVPNSAPNPYAGCNNFSGNLANPLTTAGCQDAVKTYSSSCKYPQYYSFVPPVYQGTTMTKDRQCVFKAPATEPPSPSPSPATDSACKKASGICQASATIMSSGNISVGVGNQCPSGKSYDASLTPSCGTNQMCCVPTPPHTCSTVYKGTCGPSCTSGTVAITDPAAVTDCKVNSTGNPVCCAPASSGDVTGGSGPTPTPKPVNLGTCSTNGQYICTTDYNKGVITYQSNSSNTSNQCGKNAAAAKLSPSTFVYCSCTKTTCPAVAAISVAFTIPAIGLNTTLGDNNSPKHTPRPVTLLFFKTSQNPVSDKPVFTAFGSATYNNTTGQFVTGAIKLSTGDTPTGTYQVYLQETSMLRKLVGASVSLTVGSTTNLTSSPLALLPGDIAPNNTLDIADYNAIYNCYGSRASTSSCVVGLTAADLNDDGVVNGIDYNMFIRSYIQVAANNFKGD